MLLTNVSTCWAELGWSETMSSSSSAIFIPKDYISRLPFWCASICSLPLGWLGFSFPGPKWLRACCGWGDAWVAWSRVGLNLFPSLLNFSAASTSHFHFSTHHLAASSSLLPDHGMPAWDLLPPAAAHLLMRPLGILSTPSLSLPNMLLHWSKLMHT